MQLTAPSLSSTYSTDVSHNFVAGNQDFRTAPPKLARSCKQFQDGKGRCNDYGEALGPIRNIVHSDTTSLSTDLKLISWQPSL